MSSLVWSTEKNNSHVQIVVTDRVIIKPNNRISDPKDSKVVLKKASFWLRGVEQDDKESDS